MSPDQLRQLARTFELLITASSNDFGQLITGKLERLGQEPMMSKQSYRRQLVAPTSVCKMRSEDSDRESVVGETGADTNDVGALQETLNEINKERRSLQDDVSILRGKLEGMN